MDWVYPKIEYQGSQNKQKICLRQVEQGFSLSLSTSFCNFEKKIINQAQKLTKEKYLLNLFQSYSSPYDTSKTQVMGTRSTTNKYTTFLNNIQ